MIQHVTVKQRFAVFNYCNVCHVAVYYAGLFKFVHVYVRAYAAEMFCAAGDLALRAAGRDGAVGCFKRYNLVHGVFRPNAFKVVALSISS